MIENEETGEPLKSLLALTKAQKNVTHHVMANADEIVYCFVGTVVVELKSLHTMQLFEPFGQTLDGVVLDGDVLKIIPDNSHLLVNFSTGVTERVVKSANRPTGLRFPHWQLGIQQDSGSVEWLVVYNQEASDAVIAG